MRYNCDMTTDLFLGGKLKILQYKKGFRSGSDAVLLASFITGTNGTFLEVGCSTGVSSLCLAARLPQAQITGIDVADQLVELATLNAQNNKLENQCKFLTEDIRESTLPKQSFDHVFSNPPYFEPFSPSPQKDRAIARTQSFPLSDWISACIKMAKPRGRVSFIYPTSHLHLVIQAMEGLGDIIIFPLWSDESLTLSKRVLISGRKNVKTGLNLHSGLILHHQDGTYTPQAQYILKEGKGLITDV